MNEMSKQLVWSLENMEEVFWTSEKVSAPQGDFYRVVGGSGKNVADNVVGPANAALIALAPVLLAYILSLESDPESHRSKPSYTILRMLSDTVKNANRGK